MEPPKAGATLAPPVGPLSALRVSQETEMMASEFGRELLRRTKELRAKTYVPPPTQLPPAAQWNCSVCDSTWHCTMDRKSAEGRPLPRFAVAPTFKGHEGHEPYCLSCICEWVQVKVSEMNPVIPCLNPTCKKELTLPDLKPYLDARLYRALDNVQLAACLTAMKDTRYCPVCNALGFLNNPSCFDAECLECGWQFCASCLLGKHSAIRCSVAVHEVDPVAQKKFWEARVNAVWVKDHTKPCPKCKVPIEKSEGCSHMTCSKCRYQFCWICLGPYRNVFVTGAAANGSVCPCPPPEPEVTAPAAAAAPKQQQQQQQPQATPPAATNPPTNVPPPAAATPKAP